jgi:hypothetical protein
MVFVSLPHGLFMPSSSPLEKSGVVNVTFADDDPNKSNEAKHVMLFLYKDSPRMAM